MDRFLLRLPLWDTRRRTRRRCCCAAVEPSAFSPRSRPCSDPEQVLALQDETEKVTVSEPLLDYLHALVRATRQSAELRLPVSTRGAQALFRSAQAFALLQGRAFATPDDVQAVAEPVLAHRILSISSDGFGAGGREREIVRRILAQVAVPL